ncbi:MAG: peptidylprolyl isomerase, partial [Planctomycetia bacterium]
MASRSTSRRRSRQSSPARVEPLEPRLALAVTVLSPLADITRPSTATTETISVAGRFDDPDVTGTVVQFNVNTAAPNDRFFVELFDQAGPGRTDTTPKTVENFLSYVNDGSYANTIIHRSAKNQDTSPFVVQGGGFKAPTAALGQSGGTPTGIATKPAIVNEAGNSNIRGTIAMARTDDPDSATSQWFINLNDNLFLNKSTESAGYAVFGRVLGNGMTAVDAIAAVPTFNAAELYGGAFGELPLRDVPNPIPNPLVIQPGQFVTLPSISRVGEIVYTVTSSDPTLVAASFLPASGDTIPTLQLEHKPDKSGTAVITVRAASVFDPTNFKEDSFTVERQPPAPTAPGAPGVATGLPINGRVNLSWTAPASNGGSPITDYVVQHSS